MSLFNLDDIRRKIRGQGQQGFQQAFEDYNKNFNQLQERAKSRYKNANKWGLIHKILGGFGAGHWFSLIIRMKSLQDKDLTENTKLKKLFPS
jgi:hypothetical protein